MKGDSASNRVVDQLLAVLFIDIEKFSSVMELEHDRAVRFVMDLKAVLDKAEQGLAPLFRKPMGDGWLLIFERSSDAVECALKVQELMRQRNEGLENPQERFQVRLGLHHGELTKLPFDFLGNSINIAARVMTLGDPGGLAMTKAFFDEVRNKVGVLRKARGTALRFVRVKNIKGWISVYLTPPGPLQGRDYLRWWARRHRLDRWAWGAGAAALAALVFSLHSPAADHPKALPASARDEAQAASLPALPTASPKEEPAALAGLRAQVLSQGRVKLSWEQVPGASAYLVEFRRSKDKAWAKVRSLSPVNGGRVTKTSVTCTDFMPGPAQFRVAAQDSQDRQGEAAIADVVIRP